MENNAHFDRPKVDLKQYSLPKFSKSYTVKPVIYVVILILIVYFLSLKISKLSEHALPVNEITHITVDTTLNE